MEKGFNVDDTFDNGGSGRSWRRREESDEPVTTSA